MVCGISTCASNHLVLLALYPPTSAPASWPLVKAVGILLPDVMWQICCRYVVQHLNCRKDVLPAGLFASAAAFGQSSSATTGGMIGTGALFGAATGAAAFGASQPATGGLFGTPQSAAAASGLPLGPALPTVKLTKAFFVSFAASLQVMMLARLVSDSILKSAM